MVEESLVEQNVVGRKAYSKVDANTTMLSQKMLMLETVVYDSFEVFCCWLVVAEIQTWIQLLDSAGVYIPFDRTDETVDGRKGIGAPTTLHQTPPSCDAAYLCACAPEISTMAQAKP